MLQPSVNYIIKLAFGKRGSGRFPVIIPVISR